MIKVPIMAELLNDIDKRTKLAGSNNFEVLCFKINEQETYGINVFKVREIIQLPELTKTVRPPKGIKGIVSVRGDIIPVIDLNEWFNMSPYEAKLLILTEFSGWTQAFLASSVTRIYRVEWERVFPVDKMLTNSANDSAALTAIVRLDDGTLISILDVESIVTGINGTTFENENVVSPRQLKGKILYAEDSAIAKKQMVNLFKKLELEYNAVSNGEEAWLYLENLSKIAHTEKKPISDYLNLIVTDIEMPMMDGYVLTQKIRAHPDFKDIPVLMYSSLSSVSNEKRGIDLGANIYINKFDAEAVTQALNKLLI